LNALAPVFQARSDTFKIISYGDVQNTDGSIAASAKCELLVQRTPDPVDADTLAKRMNPGQNGRIFKVLSLKWLN